MLTYIALTLALVGILMAWRASRKNKALQERISETNSRIYNLRREQQAALEQAELERLNLKFELLKLQGDLQVTPETKIGEVMLLHPQAQQVLAGFHLGGCASCFVDERQTLAEAAAVNGRDLAPILVALNTLIAEPGKHENGPVAAEQLKAPNVELRF